MENSQEIVANRRVFLGGVAAIAVLILPGCKATADFVVTRVVKILMRKSSERGIDNLMAEGGSWDQEITATTLKQGSGLAGIALSRLLTSEDVKKKASTALKKIARAATNESAPIIADTIRKIGIRNVKKIVEGGPDAATAYLREHMQGAIADSAVGNILVAMQSEEAGQIATLLRGVSREDVGGAAKNFAQRVEDMIWIETAKAEGEIRANPELTGDKTLIEVFGKAVSNRSGS